MRLAYSCFYRLMRKASIIDVPVDAGDFAILSRRVVDVLCAMPEQRRFLRGMRAWAGFRQTGLPIDRGFRFRGRSKFTIGRLVALAFDGFFGFSESPLRAIGAVGFASALTSLGFLIYACLSSLGMGKSYPGWAWVGGLVGFFGGGGLLASAVLGEYMCRILRELSGRPLYVVANRLGFEDFLHDRFIASSGFGRIRGIERGYWDASGDDSLRDPQSLH
jgi:dolichol-phosphate mannosyltransferase